MRGSGWGWAASVGLAAAVLAGRAPTIAPPEQALAASPPPTAPTADGRCTTDDLDARLVARTDELGAHRVAVVWTNRSAGTCTLSGFGGVDLDGPEQEPYGPVYSLPRADDRPATVTLARGESAESVLNYLSPEGGDGDWVPTQARVAPPDGTHSLTLPWSFGPVTRQDGATRPGTFLHPVTTPPRTEVAPCTADDVVAELAGGDAGAGNRSASLELRGRPGRAACSLAGPLPIVLRDAGRVTLTRDPIDAPASTVLVDAGRSATVRLHWTAAGTPQITPQGLTVRLPGTADAIPVRWSQGPVDASDQHFSISAGPLTAG